MRIRNKRDFVSGALFVLFGIGFASISRGYNLGTAKTIGPGYFPFLLGSVLAGLGLVVALKSLSPNTPETPLKSWHWRPVAWISASIMVFALALPKLGLLLTIALMAGMAFFACDEKRSGRETGLLIIVLMAFAYFVFVKGLLLQFQVWPVFLKAGGG
jgi:hypothetical protein